LQQGLVKAGVLWSNADECMKMHSPPLKPAQLSPDGVAEVQLLNDRDGGTYSVKICSGGATRCFEATELQLIRLANSRGPAAWLSWLTLFGLTEVEAKAVIEAYVKVRAWRRGELEGN
jgi:hypothetical protein